MKIVDANVLMYAINSDAPRHEPARRWLETQLSGNEPVGFAWIVLLAVLRLSTRSGLFARPLTPEQGFSLIDAWLAAPAAQIVHPGVRHARLLRELLLPLGVAGNLSSDAHLAAIALEYGAELVSSDNDFARFPGLQWVNPLG